MLALDPGLGRAARLSALGGRVAASPLPAAALLIGLGAASGLATMLLDFDLRLPGHAVLRSVLPMALGLSLVPRRGGATLMAAAAGATVLAASSVHTPSALGPGALTSLLLLGPLLDAGLRRVRGGVPLIATFAVCGLLANAAAFGVRLAAKLAAPVGGRPVSSWWPGALASYTLCGIVAGAVAAVLLFHVRPPTSPTTPAGSDPRA